MFERRAPNILCSYPVSIYESRDGKDCLTGEGQISLTIYALLRSAQRVDKNLHGALHQE